MSAETHKTLRRWAYAAGYIESELDEAAHTMTAATLREAAERIRHHKDEARGAVQATKVVDFCADLIDPDKEGSAHGAEAGRA